jgi:hypothetical protein
MMLHATDARLRRTMDQASGLALIDVDAALSKSAEPRR